MHHLAHLQLGAVTFSSLHVVEPIAIAPTQTLLALTPPWKRLWTQIARGLPHLLTLEMTLLCTGKALGVEYPRVDRAGQWMPDGWTWGLPQLETLILTCAAFLPAFIGLFISM